METFALFGGESSGFNYRCIYRSVSVYITDIFGAGSSVVPLAATLMVQLEVIFTASSYTVCRHRLTGRRFAILDQTAHISHIMVLSGW